MKGGGGNAGMYMYSVRAWLFSILIATKYLREHLSLRCDFEHFVSVEVIPQQDGFSLLQVFAVVVHAAQTTGVVG